MKYIYVTVCLLSIFSTVYGIITPSRIAELQALHKKIVSGAMSASDIQRLFTQLVVPLSEYDRKNVLVTAIIQSAQEKNIMLQLDGKIVTQIPKPSKEIRESIEKKGPIPVVESLREEASVQKIESVQKKESTQKVESKQKLAVEVPATQSGSIEKKPTEKDLLVITQEIMRLKKEHKSMELVQLTQAIETIQKKINGFVLPKELYKTYKSVVRFEQKFKKDLEFLEILSNELGLFFQEGRYKDALTDLNALREFIVHAEKNEADIKSFLNERIYPHNKTMESAVDSAVQKSLRMVYKVVRESMQKAVASSDDLLLRKLIRIYMQIVARFPVYSQQQLDKKNKKILVKKSVELFNQMVNNYTAVNPQEVERRFDLLLGYADFLNVEQEIILNEVLRYLEEVTLHIAMLDGVDVFLENVTKFIATQPTDVQKIENKLHMFFAFQDECDKIKEEQRKSKGVWILERLNKTQQQLEQVGKTLDTLLAVAEKKQEEESLFQSMNEWYDQQNVVMPTSESSDVPTVVPSLISKDFSITSGSKKLQKEQETHLQDLFSERNKE